MCACGELNSSLDDVSWIMSGERRVSDIYFQTSILKIFICDLSLFPEVI